MFQTKKHMNLAGEKLFWTLCLSKPTVSNPAEDRCQPFIYLEVGWLICFFTVVIGTNLWTVQTVLLISLYSWIGKGSREVFFHKEILPRKYFLEAQCKWLGFYACFEVQLKGQLHSVFPLLAFTRHFSKCQVLCSVLKLFDFDFPLTVGAEDQHQAEPEWIQHLGQGH